MPPLRELQAQFAAAVLAGEPAHSPAWVRADGITAAARLEIYRNNVRSGFCRTLALEFPVLQRLVGVNYFRQLAHGLLALHPSRSGDLHHVGAPFPRYLQSQFAGSEYLYLADIARLEWAYQECLVAEQSPCLEYHALRNYPNETYDKLRFPIRAACRLVASPFPIRRIWQANQDDIALPDFIDLTSGPDNVVLARTCAGMTCTSVTAAEYRLLEQLTAGETLGCAFESALGLDRDFDLGACLRRCLHLGVFGPQISH